MEKVRTTIVLPEETAARLREVVPARKRSEFIAEAIEQRLMQLSFQMERERSFGSWGDGDYDHLQSAEDMRRYIGALRDDESWRRPGGAGSV